MHDHDSNAKTWAQTNICVWKWPLFGAELSNGEIDIVSVTNPAIIVHECKFRVDGVTKYVEN